MTISSRCCARCGQVGHYKSTCSAPENLAHQEALRQRKAAENRQYHAKNRTRLTSKRHEWRLHNPEAHRAAWRRSNARNRDRRIEYCRFYNNKIRDEQWHAILQGGEKVITDEQHDCLVKRWNQMEAERRNLDFARSKWSREARDIWPPGEDGDRQFKTWCTARVGMTGAMANEILSRAEAVALVPDADEWKKLGGFGQIRHLLLPMSKAERAAVLSTARRKSQPIRAVVVERGLIRKRERANPFEDAESLAWFIAGAGVEVPPRILEVMQRYGFMTKKRAA